MDVEAAAASSDADPVPGEELLGICDCEALLDMDVEAAPDFPVAKLMLDTTIEEELCGEWLTQSTFPIKISQAGFNVRFNGGFQALRVAVVIPNAAEIASQLSPETTAYVSVHAVGVAEAEEETVLDGDDESAGEAI